MLKIGKTPSQIIVVLYIAATLWFRFLLEDQFGGHFLISIGFGAFCLLFLWALVKVKFLNPGWF